MLSTSSTQGIAVGLKAQIAAEPQSSCKETHEINCDLSEEELFARSGFA